MTVIKIKESIDLEIKERINSMFLNGQIAHEVCLGNQHIMIESYNSEIAINLIERMGYTIIDVSLMKA